MPRHDIAVPSPAQAQAGSRLALENADRHLRCGEALALSREFGMATSHMVLAAEEALKAGVLAMLGEGIELPLRMLAAILTQHKPRQTVGALLALGQFFLATWSDMISSLDQKHPDSSTLEYIEDRRIAVANLVQELNRAADASPGESRIIDVLDWWAQSNHLKQRGFYVDIKDGEWSGPYSLSEFEFNTARDIAREVVESTHRAMSATLEEPKASRGEFVRNLNKQLDELGRRFRSE